MPFGTQQKRREESLSTCSCRLFCVNKVSYLKYGLGDTDEWWNKQYTCFQRSMQFVRCTSSPHPAAVKIFLFSFFFLCSEVSYGPHSLLCVFTCVYVRDYIHRGQGRGGGMGAILYYSSVVMSERSWQHLWTYRSNPPVYVLHLQWRVLGDCRGEQEVGGRQRWAQTRHSISSWWWGNEPNPWLLGPGLLATWQ